MQPAVVWAGESERLTVHDPATPVWGLEELAERAEDVWQGRSLAEETVRRVVNVLEQAVEAAKEDLKEKR